MKFKFDRASEQNKLFGFRFAANVVCCVKTGGLAWLVTAFIGGAGLFAQAVVEPEQLPLELQSPPWASFIQVSDTSSVLEIAKRLVVADRYVHRKDNLQRIVGLCDQLLPVVEAVEAEGLQIELLYRKGRALGYQELPDVVQRHPIVDPQALGAAFNATFHKLDQLADTTSTDLILLRIRYERRRRHYAEALRLVELYRLTHPDARWHSRKRQDILFEMGLYPERYPVKPL